MTNRGRGRARLFKPTAPSPLEPSSSSGVSTLSPVTFAPSPVGVAQSSSGRGSQRPSGISSPSVPSVRSESPSVSLKSERPEISAAGDGNKTEITRIVSESLKQCQIVQPDKPAYKPYRTAEPVVDVGSSGIPIKVRANCLKLTYKKELGFHLYHVDFEPEVDDVRIRKKLVISNIALKRGIRCYDGGSLMYMPDKIDFASKDCELDGVKYKLTFRLTRIMELNDCAPLFGTLLRNCCEKIGYTKVGRHHYDLTVSKDIRQHCLQVWSGFITAVEEKEDGLYLTLETTSRVLHTDTGLNALKKLQRTHGDVKSMAIKSLVGTSVITYYNNKLYRIDDIDFDASPEKTSFQLRDGTKIFIKDYFMKQHKMKITDPHQPLFVVRTRKAGVEDGLVYLVPELTYVTGITDEMRKDFKVNKELAQYTKLSPDVRRNAIRNLVKKIKENEECRSLLNDWGLDIADDGVELDARVMPSFKVEFGQKSCVEGKQDWKQEVKSNAIFRGVDMNNWIIFYQVRDQGNVDQFCEIVARSARTFGIRIEKPRLCAMPNDRISTIKDFLQNQTNSNTEAVVVLLSGQRADCYSAIKKFCICDSPMASQVVLNHNLNNRNKIRAVVLNVVLQIQAKLGGALWKVPIPLKKSMICGIDTYHDAGGKNSVAAFTSSIDEEFTRYSSSIVRQDPKIELNMAAYRCVSKSLMDFHKVNNVLPDRIIVFRDGVSHGDYIAVEREIEQLEKACRDYHPSYQPKLLFVLCVKRINLRYYTAGPKADNVPPGTVVDHGVTNRNYRDCLIVSQTSSQGTLSPTHYVVLRNETGLTMDRIQRIIYFLCHMYYNWPGTVRVPAPCLYAHKLAGLIGQYVQNYPHTSINDKLFYL